MLRQAFVLSTDPGFAAMGLTLVKLDRDPKHDEILTLQVFRTQKSNKKQKVLAAEDNVRRGRELVRLTHPWISKKYGSDLIAISAEAMSFPRSSSAAAKLAMAWGMIVTFAELHQLPILQASPKEIKKATTGKSSATKEDVEESLKIKYGLKEGDKVLKEFYRSTPASLREHAWDALGAFVACQESEAILLARKML